MNWKEEARKAGFAGGRQHTSKVRLEDGGGYWEHRQGLNYQAQRVERNGQGYYVYQGWIDDYERAIIRTEAGINALLAGTRAEVKFPDPTPPKPTVPQPVLTDKEKVHKWWNTGVLPGVPAYQVATQTQGCCGLYTLSGMDFATFDGLVSAIMPILKNFGAAHCTLNHTQDRSREVMERVGFQRVGPVWANRKPAYTSSIQMWMITYDMFVDKWELENDKRTENTLAQHKGLM